MNRNELWMPVVATVIGIGFFSAMDAVMKSAAIAIGAYSAYLLRCAIGTAMIGPVWLAQRRTWPARNIMRVHLIRGFVTSLMGVTFFYALVRLPLAEAIALSFIAPLIALYLAAVLLGEKIKPRAIVAALLGLAGVVIIVAGRIGRERMTEDALWGLAALMLSAVLYAWNLVLQRQQALLASPVEVSTFQNGVVSLVLVAGAPFLLQLPEGRVWLELTAGAALAVAAALCLTWGYARAEAQVLVPIEYTGFLWAALFGWLFFAEPVFPTTLAGAILIVAGCWIAARARHTEQASI